MCALRFELELERGGGKTKNDDERDRQPDRGAPTISKSAPLEAKANEGV